MSNKNKGGRPSIPVNPVTAERLKRMRTTTVINGRRETQKDLGKVIGYKGATYARYEKGVRGIAYEDLEKLALHWNTFVEYLTGEEDYSTEEERVKYVAEQQRQDMAAFEEIAEQEKAKIEQYNSLFSISGFEYSKQSGSHLVKDPATGITATLDNSELQALVDRIRTTIQVECLTKSKQA